MSILDVVDTNSTKITKWASLLDPARIYSLGENLRPL